MAKSNKVKEFISKLLSENVEENNDELFSDTKETPVKITKAKRVVFGIPIGENFNHKTVAEAFVGRLYAFEDDLSFARDYKSKKTIIEKRNNFLNSYKKELKRKEVNLLKEALEYSKSMENFYLNLCNEKNKDSKEYKIYMGNYQRFLRVSQVIERLIEKENTPESM